MSKSWLPHIYLFAVNLLYGAGFTIAKEIMPHYVQPFGMIGIRVLSASIFFVLFNLLRGFEKIHRSDWPRLAACGLFGIALNQLWFFKGLSLTTPINAALIMTTTPILVLIISFALKVERATRHKVIGIILGLAGAVLLISNGKAVSLNNHGDFFILLNAISYAIYLVIVKPLMSRYHPYTVVMYAFLFGLVVVTPVAWPEAVVVNWSAIPAPIWWGIVYIVLGVTIFTYLFNIMAIKIATPSLAGIYIFAQPVLAGIIALSFGKDTLTWVKVAAMLLVFVGVYQVSRTFEPKSTHKRVL